MDTNCTHYSTSAKVAQDLPSAWADWLRKFEPFGWFVTPTFKVDVSQDFADRQYRGWVRSINEALYGRRYRQRGLGITHIRATERQKRGVIHFHCLLDVECLKLHRKTFEHVWELQSLGTNGFMRIYPYDASLGAVHYLGKYVSKNGNMDLWLRPSLYKDIVSPLPSLFQGLPPTLDSTT